ncbi:MAG: hypothetical protein HXX16_16585 [Bacteroidales bacterium]|nr:hypothetical protein [Bacteroidales bacterium]
MKILKELKGVKLITKNEQKSIIGGHPEPIFNPCGEAGGVISNPPWCDLWVNGICWLCF